MGCGLSKDNSGALHAVDDSVHVMLKHDKKLAQKKGEAPKGYVPRAPHPLLQEQQEGAATDGNDGAASNAPTQQQRKPIVASEDDS